MRTLKPLALLAAVSASLVACSSSSNHRDVSINWTKTEQTIDGFGASSAFFGGTITNEMADQLFDAKKGIGLSLLRTMIGAPGDILSDGSEPTDGTAVPVATAPELTTAQQAILRGAKVWATAWTPPPIWKTTNNKNGKGTGFTSNKLDPAHYADYAKYLADFVDLMAKNGVPLMAVSPTNEPDYIASWDGAQWTPNELSSFIIQHMGPTFAERAAAVQIIAPDTASWPNLDSYLTPLLTDPAGKNYLSIVATHPYQNGNAPVVLDYRRPAQNGKKFWQSEWSQENPKGDTPNPTMTSAIDMMKRLHDHMVISKLNAWNWWALYINASTLEGSDEGKTRQNPALIQSDASKGEAYMFKRGYAFGHWSKFVRPGFQRIDATPDAGSGILAEAYRDTSHIAVIAINTSSKKVTQKFDLTGGSFGKLTPWVTSPDDNLAAKPQLTPVVAGTTETFTYELPANSVVTFVNWDATTETPLQGTLPTEPKVRIGLDCKDPVVPNNGVSGGVTDFTDAMSSGRWGNTAELWGSTYSYKGPSGSTMAASINTMTHVLHVSGGVTDGDYGGAGLGFQVCATAAPFTHLQFVITGSSPGCELEVQFKTFEQQPLQANPPGGCDQNKGSCYNFPAAKKVAVPSATPTTVNVPLATVSKWSTATAGQIVGLQWQWTGQNVDPAIGNCPIDVNISNIRFVKMDPPISTDGGATDDGGSTDTMSTVDAATNDAGVTDAGSADAAKDAATAG